MPELPEVETIVRGLAPRLAGRRIAAAEFPCARVLRNDCAAAVGQRIRGVRRRGKFILLELDEGRLEIHLGMTGKLLLDAPAGPHTRAWFDLGDTRLVYDDIRQFGKLEYCLREDKLPTDQLDELDLGSLRVLMNADLDEGSALDNPVLKFLLGNPRVNTTFVPTAGLATSTTFASDRSTTADGVVETVA